ncbi:hypothetical protein LCGC14_3089050 [marine sediment metagenome]|uniref:Uncharacterized protein n=1 Tax=marine sediment metagenome TaxID=412755 RepID=A0A0F8WB23_9ZZZZ
MANFLKGQKCVLWKNHISANTTLCEISNANTDAEAKGLQKNKQLNYFLNRCEVDVAYDIYLKDDRIIHMQL